MSLSKLFVAWHQDIGGANAAANEIISVPEEFLYCWIHIVPMPRQQTTSGVDSRKQYY